MKKLFVVLLVLAVVGTVVFAEDAKLSVGGWGRMWFNAVSSDGSDQYVSSGPGWANGCRVGVNFSGTSDNIGFNLNLDNNGGLLGSDFSKVAGTPDPVTGTIKITGYTISNMVGDQAKIWAVINPMIKVQVGKIQGDVLRGKLDDFGDILPVSGKDSIFQRFYPKSGLLLDLTPVEGAYIGAAVDAGSGGAAVKLSDAYKSIQIGGGYTIANVGMARVQYIGSAVDKGGVINAAFAYTGMEGLTADVGFKYPLDSDVQMHYAVAASYGKDALSVYGRLDGNFAGASGMDFNTSAALQAMYTVAAPISAGVEVAFAGMDAAGSKTKTLDIYPLVKFSYGQGYLKVGFDYKAGLDSQDAQYNLPIQLEYWF